LGFIISKERKLPDPKKIQAIVNMPRPKSLANSSIQWDDSVLKMFYKKLCCYYGTYHETNLKNIDFSLDKGM
jgi:hypothetical protein